jgi:hypothetical protein
MLCKSLRLLPVLMLLVYGTLASANQLSSSAKGINKANAPVPTPLLNGKKVFISFDPSDVLAFPSVYSGGPERAYSEFFADMKQWGRYEIVLDPKDADLVFSIRFVEGHDLLWPQIRVVMTEAKSNTVLWGLVEQIDGAVFKKHRDQAFSNSIMKMVDDIQELLAPGAAQPFPFPEAGKTRLSDQ